VKVRLIIIENKEWFIAKDLAELLGYSNTRDAISKHCKNSATVESFKGSESLLLELIKMFGNNFKNLRLIPESDIWRLIIKSRLPEAEKVEKWIFEEVLPSIRKTGSYSISEISKLEKQANLISVSTENMRKEFEALEFTFKHQNFSELEKKKLLNQTLRKINFTNLDSLTEHKETFSLTELLEIFYISILPQDFNRKLKNFGIIKWSQGNWILLDLKFGRNCPFDENSNPRYFKQTFQNLLDIVL